MAAGEGKDTQSLGGHGGDLGVDGLGVERGGEGAVGIEGVSAARKDFLMCSKKTVGSATEGS